MLVEKPSSAKEKEAKLNAAAHSKSTTAAISEQLVIEKTQEFTHHVFVRLIFVNEFSEQVGKNKQQKRLIIAQTQPVHMPINTDHNRHNSKLIRWLNIVNGQLESSSRA